MLASGAAAQAMHGGTAATIVLSNEPKTLISAFTVHTHPRRPARGASSSAACASMLHEPGERTQ